MPTTPLAPLALRSALRSASLGVAGVVGVMLLAGCTVTDQIDETPATAEPLLVEPTPAEHSADARLDRYLDALQAGGFPDVVPAPTLFALGDGVCRQSSTGTPDSSILEHLQPMGAYGASLSGGALTADAATRLLLDAARSSFC